MNKPQKEVQLGYTKSKVFEPTWSKEPMEKNPLVFSKSIKSLYVHKTSRKCLFVHRTNVKTYVASTGMVLTLDNMVEVAGEYHFGTLKEIHEAFNQEEVS